jgi:hypothetical protein
LQVLSHVRDCVPQLPHGCELVSPGVQAPCPHVPNVPHVHAALHVRVCVPQFPQAWESLASGAHSPWVLQLPYVPQRQFAPHVRDCVPQLPHVEDCVAPASHSPGQDGALSVAPASSGAASASPLLASGAASAAPPSAAATFASLPPSPESSSTGTGTSVPPRMAPHPAATSKNDGSASVVSVQTVRRIRMLLAA